eukprot:216522-Ditylum_brightwellii.AAC.1
MASSCSICAKHRTSHLIATTAGKSLASNTLWTAKQVGSSQYNMISLGTNSASWAHRPIPQQQFATNPTSNQDKQEGELRRDLST